MAGTAQATQQTWSATAGTTAWATATNWTSGTAPVSSLTTDTAYFNSATYTAQPNAGNTSIAGIQIGSGNTSGTLVITETVLSIGSSGILKDVSSGSATISGAGAASIKLGANQNWANNSSTALTVGTSTNVITNFGNITPFTLTFSGSGSGATTVNSIIQDGGAIGKTAVVVNTTGGGTTFLKGVNTFTGGLTIQSGIVQANGATALGGATGAVTFGTGSAATNTLQFNGGGQTYANAISVLANDTTTLNVVAGGQTFTLSGNITGSGNLVVAGSLSTSIMAFNGANTYTGTTSVTAGVLKAGVASVGGTSGAFGLNSAITMSNTLGAALNITGFNTQIGSITGGGSTGGWVTLGAATLTTGGDNSSPAAYAGIISGTNGGLTKIGSGTQTLSGSNTYTGLTTVSAGTLLSGSNNVFADASSINVNGGTLDMNSRTDTLNVVTLTNGSIVGTSGVLTGTGGYAMQNGPGSASRGGSGVALT